MVTISIDRFSFDLEWRGTVLGKPQDFPTFGYLSYPSVLYDRIDQLYKMWFAGWPHDFIYYGEAADKFGPFSWNYNEQSITPGPCDANVPRFTPGIPPCSYQVARYTSPFPAPNAWICLPTDKEDLSGIDSIFTADPFVLKVDIGGEYRYYMWYTGTSEGGGHYNSIFFAESMDGKVWTKKYRQVPESGQLVLCSPFLIGQIPSNCNPRSADSSGRGYGAGQSSVIQLPTEYLHYHSDTTVKPDESTVRLVKMTGPFDFVPPSLPVIGLGRTDSTWGSWDVKLHSPTNRLIAFATYDPPGAEMSALLISVSEHAWGETPDAPYRFCDPVMLLMSDIGVPGINMNNGCLLGNEAGWIEHSDTAYYFGHGITPRIDDWTIGALQVQITAH